ncbi:MAG TPA: transcriptional regulator [Marinilabiliaceae bacterium]|nr:transcriptional regulator [Marinilabiliaceae bacterium]HBX88201.1 transcriptional regulator [Marinilabiliaceae bacterium]
MSSAKKCTLTEHELQTRASGGNIPKEITIEDKTAVEQMRLIGQLEEEDKQTIFRLIDKMLTNEKFKDFFNKNIAAL